MSRPARSGLGASLALAAVIVVIDQITKHWAVNSLTVGVPRHVVGPLKWSLHYNSGMAFGRATGAGPILGAVALVVVVFLLLTLRTAGGRLSKVAVGLVIGGAVGNLADRLFRQDAWLRGRVVDFIKAVDWFPIFNVADMAVTVGGMLLVLGALLQSRPGAQSAAHSAAASAVTERVGTERAQPQEPARTETAEL